MSSTKCPPLFQPENWGFGLTLFWITQDRIPKSVTSTTTIYVLANPRSNTVVNLDPTYIFSPELRVGLENNRCEKINYSTEMTTVKVTTREIPDKQR